MGRIIEDGDELGLPWDEWADGRVHRLRKGIHFTRGVAAVDEAAKHAAARLGRSVRVVKEMRGDSIAVWVQFADHEIVLGHPCPSCGSRDIRRVNHHFGICAACRATLTFAREKRRDGALEAAGPAPDPDEVVMNVDSLPLLAAIAEAFGSAQDEADTAETIAPASEPAGATVDAAIGQPVANAPTEDETAGPAEHGDQVLDAAQRRKARLGRRRQAQRAEREEVRAVERSEIQSARLSMLQNKAEAARRRAEQMDAPDPMTRLSHYDDFRLFLYDRLPERERYYGYGVRPDGMRLILFVRFPLRDGQRIPDAAEPSCGRHVVRWVPAEPFEGLIDFAALEQREGALRPVAGTAPNDVAPQLSPAKSS